jgi:tetratricopeptide (TPR) repeat protein
MRDLICVGAAFSLAVVLHTTANAQQSSDVKAQCMALHAKGIELHDAGKYDEAIAVYQDGFDRCGDGFGFLGEIGLSLVALNRFDEAVDHLIRAVESGSEGPEALTALVYLIRVASSETRDRIMALGKSEAGALRVLQTRDEYVWMNYVACYPASGKQVRQSLIKDGDRFLDRLDFDCDDKRTVFRYFVTRVGK